VEVWSNKFGWFQRFQFCNPTKGLDVTRARHEIICLDISIAC
jgi:hypothetical protein